MLGVLWGVEECLPQALAALTCLRHAPAARPCSSGQVCCDAAWQPASYTANQCCSPALPFVPPRPHHTPRDAMEALRTAAISPRGQSAALHCPDSSTAAATPPHACSGKLRQQLPGRLSLLTYISHPTVCDAALPHPTAIGMRTSLVCCATATRAAGCTLQQHMHRATAVAWWHSATGGRAPGCTAPDTHRSGLWAHQRHPVVKARP